MRTGETEWMEPLESAPAVEMTKALFEGLIFVKCSLPSIKGWHVDKLKKYIMFCYMPRASKHSTLHDATKASSQTSRGILKPLE